MKYRTATILDAQRIAALHIENWRETYRGSMLDAYLDHDIELERPTHWQQRLSHPPPNMTLFLAEDGAKLCGFVCAFGNHHPKFGTLVENLHSHKSVRGLGVGKRLLGAAADWSLTHYPNAGLYLDVLESNTAAQGFYAALGGVHVEDRPWEPPGGGEVIEYSYYWADPSRLLLP